jgi:hypothetical protein
MNEWGAVVLLRLLLDVLSPTRSKVPFVHSPYLLLAFSHFRFRPLVVMSQLRVGTTAQRWRRRHGRLESLRRIGSFRPRYV